MHRMHGTNVRERYGWIVRLVRRGGLAYGRNSSSHPPWADKLEPVASCAARSPLRHSDRARRKIASSAPIAPAPLYTLSGHVAGGVQPGTDSDARESSWRCTDRPREADLLSPRATRWR